MGVPNNGVDLESIGKLLEVVKSDPKMAGVRFFANSKWLGGTKTEVTIKSLHAGNMDIARPDREFKLIVDEPPQLGGSDTAPNPVEYLLAAICGCVTAGIATNSALFETNLNGIEIGVSAGCDLHGVLGLDNKVPNGCGDIEYSVKITGKDGIAKEKMIKSKETIDRKSPVLSTLRQSPSLKTDVSAV